MDKMVLTAMMNNAAALLVLSVVFDLVHLIPLKSRYTRSVLSGVLISLICIAIMEMPLILQPGIVFDTRSILISVTALMFGTIPTAITVAAASVLRITMGGSGTLPGIAVILSSALIGSAWRRWIYPKARKWRWTSILLMGMVVHVVMIAWMLCLPYPSNIEIIRAITVPVLLIYPAATLVLSQLLLRQQRYRSVQRQLQQSEERFRNLFEKAPLGYQALDADGCFVEVNQQWLDALGYARDEVIGKCFGEFLPPQAREAFREQFAAFKAQGHVHTEIEMVSKSGKAITIAFDGKTTHDMHGGFMQMHCILQNITEQKEAQERLRVSEENYRRLFETMSQGVVYQAAGGEIISANPAAERILGITVDQMRGKTSMDPRWKAIDEDGRELPGANHPAMVALRTGKPFGPFIMGVFKPEINDHVWLSIMATPLMRPGETTAYQAYALFQDITEQRKAENNFRLLFTEMLDAFAVHEMILDGQGEPVDYRFLAVNPAFERMTGLKAQDIVGRTVLEVMPETERYWIQTYGRVALTGEPVQFENYSAATGKFFSVSAYQPKAYQFACTFTDITKRILAEKEVQAILARLMGLMENSPGLIMIIDSGGTCVDASSFLCDMLHATREALRGKAVAQFLPAPMAEKVLHAISQAVEAERIREDIDVFEHDGETLYFESRLFPIRASDHADVLYGYIGIDISRRIRAEQALKASEEKYSSYIRNAPDGIIILTDDGRLIETNAAVSLISGYSTDELQAMRIADMLAESTSPAVRRLFEELERTGAVRGEVQYRHRNGSIRWAQVGATLLSPHRYLCFLSDITAQKAAEESLIYTSTHDYLTGLVNRRYYNEQEERLNTPEHLPLSVIIGDINGLKLINDSFGRKAGDAIIVETAGIIRRFCRAGDVLAKTGGDEFTMLLPKTSYEDAVALIESIQAACQGHRFYSDNESYQVSISFGAGTKQAADEKMIDVYRQAEDNMNQHKLLEKRSSQSAIIASIQAAMLEKSHETEAHSERLVMLARKVGAILNLSQTDMDHLELLATLHDIGKIGISEHILNKPDKLDANEWVEMKKHPEIGYRIALSTSNLAPIAEYILCHHERWDGGGYPQKLAGEAIPLLSRILAVVDAYDAMTQDRPYRKAIPHREALGEIARCAGTQFDPAIVDVFLHVLNGASIAKRR